MLKSLFTIILVLFIISSTVKAQINHEILIVRSEKNDLKSYEQYQNALSSVGLNIGIITVSEVSKHNLYSGKVLVIPGDIASHLNTSQINSIVQQVKNGLCLVTDRHTNLSEKLGVIFNRKKIRISGIKDINHPDVCIRWKESVISEQIENTLTGAESAQIFCTEPAAAIPVVIGAKSGKGKFIYISTEFDDPKAFGYGHFPYFHESFIKFFDVQPCKKRNRLVAYLDLGYHENDSLPLLVENMKSYGINEVHISGWYSNERYGKVYEKILNECHQNGILAYMWLELPMVTSEFWDNNPIWRQKTGALSDAALDWRKLMALEDPECFRAVTGYLSGFIDAYEWDGIDIAEFYFESLEGYKRPAEFTPLSDFSRKEFREINGFDPAEIFNPESSYYYKKNRRAIKKFLDFRVDLCTKLNREILTFVRNKNASKKLDIYLTQIANPFDKKLNRNIGVNVDDFIKLQKEFGFTMQAEDPYPLWVLGPDRYKKIGKVYRKLLGNKPILTIDINIVSEGRDDPFPTDVQTGLEFTELLNVASQSADRVCIYAVSTPLKYDYKYAPYALASDCSIRSLSGKEISTSSYKSFWIELDSAISEVFMNGKTWKCVTEKSILVPAGRNSIKFIYGNSNSQSVFIREISCELSSYEMKNNLIELSYNENRNVYVTLNRFPRKIILNGKDIVPKCYYNQMKNNYILLLPAGSNSICLSED